MFGEVKEAFSENRLAIYISVAILFICLILGYLLEPHLYSYLNPVVEDLTQKVETGVIRLTFFDIFMNNLSVIVRMFLFGLVFCISAVVLAFNGFFVGYYVGTSDNLLQVLLYIIPHGIFEFSSCILACAASFVLFNFLYRFLKAFMKDENESVMEGLKNSFGISFIKLKQALILFGISVILMAIAGVIEAYLTIPIAEFFISILS